MDHKVEVVNLLHSEVRQYTFLTNRAAYHPATVDVQMDIMEVCAPK